MTTFVGIDPDLHCTAIATWDHLHNQPEHAWVVKTPKSKGTQQQSVQLHIADLFQGIPLFPRCNDIHFFAVEAQTLQRTGGNIHTRPQDIVVLGNVAGAILGILRGRGYHHVEFPAPELWKGGVAKSAMQARLYQQLGMGYVLHGKGSAAYAVPERIPHHLSNIKGQEWKHVGDAILLARWAYWQTLPNKGKRRGRTKT
jgi:hypothetical protein